jgi:hypothetical protein
MTNVGEWSDWRQFPDPRKGAAGCYNVRHGKQLILFGMGGHVASRMTSLLPSPLGKGTRNNSKKRQHLLEHLSEIEYQTLACEDRAAAVRAEKAMAVHRNDYLFRT